MTKQAAKPQPGQGQSWWVKAAAIVVALTLAYATQSILIPITGAVLLSITLSPLVRWLSKRGVPRQLAAFGFASLVTALSLVVLVTLGALVGNWLDNAPEYMERLGDRLEVLRQPLDELSEATETLNGESAQPEARSPMNAWFHREPPAQADEDKKPLKVDESFWLNVAGVVLGQSVNILAGFFICITLTFFLLLSGDVFLAKLLSLSPSLTGKKEVMSIVREIEAEISRFLSVWTLINAGVGLVVWGVFTLLGVPNAWLWGVTSMLFNYVPYAGPWVLGAFALFMGLLNFRDPLWIVMPAAVILVVNVVEGFFISPMLHGRRLNLNTVAVFLAVILGGFLWGIAGALMAVPILVVVYVVCSHLPSLKAAALFLDDSAPGLHRGAHEHKGDASSNATPPLGKSE
ncbi:MAG: AI-2E family transporter [Phycisphaerales bacterium JB063]